MSNEVTKIKVFDGLKESEKYSLILAIVLSVVLRVIVSLIIIPGDYVIAFLPWIEEYRKYGFFEGLGHTIGDYYVPYNVILDLLARVPFDPWIGIVLISVVMDYVLIYFLCMSAMKLHYYSTGKVSEKYKKNIILLYKVLIFFPIVFLDSTIWRQCDSIYIGLCFIGLYYMFSNCYNKAFIFYGVALSFKLQTVFILPFCFVYMVCTHKNILKSVVYFIYIPVVYVACGLPAILAGRGLLDTLGVYHSQTSMFETMASVVPSIYYFVLKDYSRYSLVAIGLTGVILLAFLTMCYTNKNRIKVEDWLYVAAMMTWTVVFFLPAMHERYVYMPMVLLLAVSIVMRRKVFIPMVVANVIVLYSCFVYLTGHSPEYMTLMPIPSIFYIIAYIWVMYDFIKYMFIQKKSNA